MLIDADLANQFWGEAVMTVTYLQNHLPTRAIEKAPYEAWFGKQSEKKHIRTFGCKAFKHVPNELRRELDNKAIELTFEGYAAGSKAYRLLD